MSAGRDVDRERLEPGGMAPESTEDKETSVPSKSPVFTEADQGACPRCAPEPAPILEPPATGINRDPVTGRLLPGHTVSLKTGEFSTRVWRALLPGQEAQLAKLGDRRAQLIADQGGESECSQIRLDLIDNYNAVVTFLEWSRDRIIREGPFTSRGRTRATVSLYLSMLDRQIKLGSMLGLDRRAHGISNPFEYLAKAHDGRLASPPASGEAIAAGAEDSSGGPSGASGVAPEPRGGEE